MCRGGSTRDSSVSFIPTTPTRSPSTTTSVEPPTVTSLAADAFSLRTGSGSERRSVRDLVVETACSVVEQTILSAACRTRAKSALGSDWTARVGSTSHTAIDSYVRRP